MSTSLSDQDIQRLVTAFYRRVRQDTELGPIFEAAIADWPAHEARLVAFWSSVMLTSGSYKGNPMAAHSKHSAVLTPELFDRWLAVWRSVTDDLFELKLAASFQNKAVRIADSLRAQLFYRPDRARPASDRPPID
jgi:hemoglobin